MKRALCLEPLISKGSQKLFIARAKVNAPEILKKELEKRIAKGKPREPVCFGSISDPYQTVERKYEITRKMVEVCDELSCRFHSH